MAYHTVMTQQQLHDTLESAQPGKVVNLSSRDLSGCDLQNTTTRAQLKRISEHNRQAGGNNQIAVDLSQANISGLNFEKLYLTGYIMTGVTAEHTIFAEADLSDVLLDNATLNYADFRYATLGYTKLYNSTIIAANFAGANLTTTYGLCFNMDNAAEKIIARLHVVHSLHNTLLPEPASKLLKDIAAA